MIPGPSTLHRRLPVLLAITCAGVVVLVIGTFLPWLVSGRVNRSSYAATGALRTLIHVHGAVTVALHIWPMISLVGALAVALIVLGHASIGGGLALLTAIVAGAVAAAAVVNTSPGLVHVATSGPVVTLAASALTSISAIAYFVQLFFASRRPA